MGEMLDRSNSSSNNEGETSESSDEDEESSTMEPAQLIARESIRPSQPAVDGAFNDTTHQIIDHLIVREPNNSVSSGYTILPSRYCGIDIYLFGYWLMLILMGLTIDQPLYWCILVFIGLVIYVINTVRFPRWTYDDRLRVRLGSIEPWSPDYTLGLNQDETGPSRIASPSDSLQPMIITYTFSTTIMEYFPLPRESIAVEDTQPHTMPATVAGNNIGPENRLVNDENNHPNTDETTQNNREEITALPAHIQPNIPIIVGENDATGMPNEFPQEFDLPDVTNERQNENESDTSSDDEQRLCPESFPYIDGENDDDALARSCQQRGVTVPNSGTNIDVVQDNTSPNQSAATTSANDSSSPQIPVTKQDAVGSTEDGRRMILAQTNPPITDGLKLPTPSNSSDESGEETEAKP